MKTRDSEARPKLTFIKSWHEFGPVFVRNKQINILKIQFNNSTTRSAKTINAGMFIPRTQFGLVRANSGVKIQETIYISVVPRFVELLALLCRVEPDVHILCKIFHCKSNSAAFNSTDIFQF